MAKRCFWEFFVCLCMLGMTELSAQSLSNMHFGSKVLDTNQFQLDSLSILPGSLMFVGIDTGDYEIDYPSATFTLKNLALLGKKITYSYRTFPQNFNRKFVNKSSEIILPRLLSDPTSRDLLSIGQPVSEPIFDSQLQGNGSISRGVSVGNNQNFVLDASMNLQLSGFLAPDVEIMANITDEKLPIQPEGNTRTIKDFNKVFIQLKYKDVIRVQAGDIELSSPENSYFMKVNRQFLGLDFQINSRFDTINSMKNTVGGGISKGKFTRNTLTPINGVQGPYKLYGSQNETSIVILAASERVYLDGILLKRGQDADYVIDYNTGELTFSTSHLITSENRIVVEFEYSDQYYSRYNLFSYNEFTHEKNSRLKLHANFVHEQDLKGRSIQPELDDAQKLFLSQIGDDLAAANYATATLTTDFSTGEILYHQVDTMVNGALYSPVYVYAGASRDSVYRVVFSFVGAHKGDYVLAQSSANGKMFRWVAPVNGVPQGDYAPVTQLNTPKMTDLLTVGADYRLSDKLDLRTELAFSYLDENLFSKDGDADNGGLAFKLEAAYQTGLKRKPSRDSLWRYHLSVNYEWAHRNFNPLESYRNIEFARDYNLASDYSTDASEQMLVLSTGFSHPGCGSTSYAANWLMRFHQLSALRNEIVSVHQFAGWKWKANTSYLFSSDSLQKTNFFRTSNDFSKAFRKLRIGVKDNLEYNVFKNAATDSLRVNSYAFNEVALYLTNSDSTGYNYFVQFRNRVDDHLYNNVLSMNTVGYEAQASFEFSRWKHNRLKGTATYRNDNVQDTLRKFVPEHNFVGSLDYAGNFWKGAVTLGVYVEAGSGLEQKKNYSFLKVAAGQGTHIWYDYNGNGIEELDEFELAAYQSEADYVKVWLTTNEYVNTFNCGSTQSLQLRPANVWRGKAGFRKFLSMLSNSTVLRTYQKSTAGAGLNALNPFSDNLDDSLLVSKMLNLKNSLGFSLPNSYFSVDYIVMNNQAKNLLYYGFESTNLRWQQVSLRSSPVKILTLKTLYTRSIDENRSQFFAARNYRILSHVLENGLSLDFPFNLSIAALCEMSYKKNLSDVEKANLYKATLEVNYRMKERGALSVMLQYINIVYNSEQANSSLSYEMLEGLTVGDNFRWKLAYQTNLFEYLQLNLLYEGRLTNEKKLIHTGTLQLKAFF